MHAKQKQVSVFKSKVYLFCETIKCFRYSLCVELKWPWRLLAFTKFNYNLQRTEMLKRWHAYTCTLNRRYYTHSVRFVWKKCLRIWCPGEYFVEMSHDGEQGGGGPLPWILRAILRQRHALNPASSSETPPRLPGEGQSDVEGERRLGERRRHGWGQSWREARQPMS